MTGAATRDTVTALLAEQVSMRPAAPAVIYQNRAISFQELDASGRRAATALAEDHAVEAAVHIADDGLQPLDKHILLMREAKLKGYEGDPCYECGHFTLVRNGTCMKCVTCGATSGCS